LVETINDLYKTEVIRRRRPWRSLDDVEFATFDYVDWFNNRCLLDPSATFHLPRQKHATVLKPSTSPWRRDSSKSVSGNPGAVHYRGFPPSRQGKLAAACQTACTAA
jgi:hypothetical protein